MKKDIQYLYLSREERSILLEAVNAYRNCCIAEGQYTDVADELLIKLTTAKLKKMKVVREPDAKGGRLQYA